MITLSRLRSGTAIIGCATVLGLGGLAAPAMASTSPTPAHTGAAAAASAPYKCTPGYFCIYNGYAGHGAQCQWEQRAVNNTADKCSWIRKGWLVRSVYNRTNHRVQYYTHDNFNHRVGSTPSGGLGSLEGTYQIRSFRPQ